MGSRDESWRLMAIVFVQVCNVQSLTLCPQKWTPLTLALSPQGMKGEGTPSLAISVAPIGMNEVGTSFPSLEGWQAKPDGVVLSPLRKRDTTPPCGHPSTGGEFHPRGGFDSFLLAFFGCMVPS
jgi:hypothetical protein